MDEFGVMLVQRMIPCSACAMIFRENELHKYGTGKEQVTEILKFMRNPEHVNQFPLTVCAMAALHYDKVQCQKHPDMPVLLAHMVPDLLLSDLPASMVLDKEKFDFEASDETRLGTGGAGEVYKAFYDGNPIAVKKFHSTKNARYSCRLIIYWCQFFMHGSCENDHCKQVPFKHWVKMNHTLVVDAA